jgi:hypothetical protein
MWHQTVSHRVRQVVHEWLIAEGVPTAPVTAMSFKRVPAIGAKRHDAPTNAADPDHFGNCQGIIDDVFQYLMVKDDVKTPIGERKPLT